ncbi:MAG: hypothetical protein GYA50_09920 [Eubacteriaceae bacterium]|nr:hypothetical protein [Eubacteriaceae bacterium]
MKTNKHTKVRHNIIANILRPPVHLFFKLFFGLNLTKYKLDKNQPYLILSNHIGGYDPIFISLSFNQPIYYVASDHLFRLSFISKILKFCFAPIPISKTMIDIKSIRHIKSVASENGCIGLFPSGNGSFNGEEAYISPAIGKLVKLLNIPVILYNLQGLYFCTPRWAAHHSKGCFNGKIVRQIEVEEIKNYSSEQLSDIIITNLKTSAYETQKANMQPYKGRNPAMYLERALYTCPHCHSRNTMQSKNDIFYCTKCNYSVKYNTFGFFESENKNSVCFDSIIMWDNWQKELLLKEYKNDILFNKDTPLYTDEKIKLFSCFYMKKNVLLHTGVLKLFYDRIEIVSDTKSSIFYLADILEIQAILGQILQFSTQDGSFYEIKSDFVYSALKYVHIINLIKNGEGQSGLFSV